MVHSRPNTLHANASDEPHWPAPVSEATGLIGLALTPQTLAGLLVSVFVVGLASAAVAPAIQTRLMDVARDSQSIAAALNHSALNIANSLGAYLGGLTIAAGLGYISPVWVGVALGIAGITVAVFSFGLDSRRQLAKIANLNETS